MGVPFLPLLLQNPSTHSTNLTGSEMSGHSPVSSGNASSLTSFSSSEPSPIFTFETTLPLVPSQSTDTSQYGSSSPHNQSQAVTVMKGRRVGDKRRCVPRSRSSDQLVCTSRPINDSLSLLASQKDPESLSDSCLTKLSPLSLEFKRSEVETTYPVMTANASQSAPTLSVGVDSNSSPHPNSYYPAQPSVLTQCRGEQSSLKFHRINETINFPSSTLSLRRYTL